MKRNYCRMQPSCAPGPVAEGDSGVAFLRDRRRRGGGEGGAPPFWAAWSADPTAAIAFDPRVQPDLNFAIVDEADSIFIDEARTPLIIGMPTRDATPEESVVY